MTTVKTIQASGPDTPWRRTAVSGRFLRAAVLGAALACALPAAASAMEPDRSAHPGAPYQVAFLGVSSPALTPGLPPPQLVGQPSGEGTVMSTRSVAAGLILVLFAGLAALTFTMWRDLGRRVGAR